MASKTRSFSKVAEIDAKSKTSTWVILSFPLSTMKPANSSASWYHRTHWTEISVCLSVPIFLKPFLLDVCDQFVWMKWSACVRRAFMEQTCRLPLSQASVSSTRSSLRRYTSTLHLPADTTTSNYRRGPGVLARGIILVNEWEERFL